MINEFLKKLEVTNYCIEPKNLLIISNEYYLINEKIRNTLSKNKERPKSAGIFIGTIKNKKFIPSLAFLDIISKNSNKKAFVDKKAQWLFLCGRDIMGQSVTKIQGKKGLILIQDSKDQNLGLGLITGKQETDQIFINNIQDKGNFLRREK